MKVKGCGFSSPFHERRINCRELYGDEEKNTSTLSPSRASAGSWKDFPLDAGTIGAVCSAPDGTARVTPSRLSHPCSTSMFRPSKSCAVFTGIGSAGSKASRCSTIPPELNSQRLGAVPVDDRDAIRAVDELDAHAVLVREAVADVEPAHVA